MLEKDVRKEICLVKGTRGFKKMDLEEQMTLLVNLGSDELKNLYYELDNEKRLPDTWKEFTELIVEFCTDEGIATARRYYDEPWSAYLKRLREMAIRNKYSDEKVFVKLRKNLRQNLMPLH